MHALVIDDDPQMRKFVCNVLREEGWELTEAASAEQAFELIDEHDWSVVFCDVVMGGADGFSVLKRFKEMQPAAKVVLMTGDGNASGAVSATSFGAYDYLLKPFGPEELQSLSRALRDQLASRPTRRSRASLGAVGYQADIGLLGRSEVFINVMKQVGRVATTNLPVLLTGESGTGKEVVASSLHNHSSRAAQPFVAVNCGAISSELIESELFGHVKGSFTGAERDRRGLWEEADNGTVFLDEITETTPAFQVKLLRALQQGEIRRVGSNHTQRVDVRVIAASNRNVEEEVEAGRFRKDLFYRLNAVSIRLPPLRDRPEDILLLAKSFAERVYSLSPEVKFSVAALEMLEKYSWPGNIRELENAVVRATAICDGTIRATDLPERVQQYCKLLAENHTAQASVGTAPPRVEDWTTLSVVEGRYVEKVLGYTGGNKQAAARLLEVDRKTLDRMIKRHKIIVSRGASHAAQVA
ncbi:MAG: two-component system, NtrC family, response regulator AtoC [Pyrinomonadaceae bacterium]|jgi:DNA-binding NtrC family response regulator|nr:two-component system, NtrC family, response regulator AtoC [Pyrinomonadaceae bacterium]